MYRKEIGWEGMDWINVASFSEHGYEPSGPTKGGEFLK
jgi:hypothetical protein